MARAEPPSAAGGQCRQGLILQVPGGDPGQPASWDRPRGLDRGLPGWPCGELAIRAGWGSTVSPPLLLGHRLKESFLVTGSQDCTVKLWPLPKALLSKNTAPDNGPILLQAQTTQRCHDKVTP